MRISSLASSPTARQHFPAKRIRSSIQVATAHRSHPSVYLFCRRCRPARRSGARPLQEVAAGIANSAFNRSTSSATAAHPRSGRCPGRSPRCRATPWPSCCRRPEIHPRLIAFQKVGGINVVGRADPRAAARPLHRDQPRGGGPRPGCCGSRPPPPVSGSPPCARRSCRPPCSEHQPRHRTDQGQPHGGDAGPWGPGPAAPARAGRRHRARRAAPQTRDHRRAPGARPARRARRAPGAGVVRRVSAHEIGRYRRLG